MENLPFVLWMLLWPLVDEIGYYMRNKSGIPEKPLTENQKAFTSLFMFMIYVFVAILVYKK